MVSLINMVLIPDTEGSSLWSTEDNHVGFGGMQAEASIWHPDASMYCCVRKKNDSEMILPSERFLFAGSYMYVI